MAYRAFKAALYALFFACILCYIFAPETNLPQDMQDKFLATMTVSEFVNALGDCGYIVTKRPEEKARPQEAPAELDFSDGSRYGCGLKAIRERYKVSPLTAQRYKDGLLAPAIFQAKRGGKFWIDYAKADEIMKARKGGKETSTQTATA